MIEVRYTTEFEKWLHRLRDERAKARIAKRVQRLEYGNFGDAKAVSGPVLEMRIDYGPGYRVYYMRRGTLVVILLCGGDKRTQQADIKRARDMADNWKD